MEEERDSNEEEREIDLTATIDEDDLLEDPVVEVEDLDELGTKIPDEEEDDEEEFLYPPGEEPEEL